MMRKQLTGLHESGGEPIAMLNTSEATIYGCFGYGIASHAAQFDGEKRCMRSRSGIDVGQGTIRLLNRDEARPLMEKVYDTIRIGTVGWVDRALATRRYAIPLDVVFEVEDTFCPWNSGHYQLQADGDSVTCERTQASADLHLTAAELGAIFLGGTTLAQLSAAGLVKELRPGAVATCTVAFRGEREPFCPTGREFPAY